MLAIIPTIRQSEYLPKLIETLVGDGVDVVLVDGSDRPEIYDDGRGVLTLRHKWNIYKTWNYGLDLGVTKGHRAVFVLNDDVIIAPGTFRAMAKLLESSGFAILSFEDPLRENQRLMRGGNPDTTRVTVSDTTLPAGRGDAHGICGYAFACDPSKTARCDEEFIWYCGDDDLFYRTAKAGNKVGVAHGMMVSHPDPMHSSKNINEIMPDGWQERDIARMREKWGSNVSKAGEGTVEPLNGPRPEMFIGIPSHDGKISAALHVYISSIQCLSALGQFPFAVNVAILTGISPVQYARNKLIALARSTRAERIVLIDDDMLPDKTCTPVLFSPADICVPRMYRFRHNGSDALTPEEITAPEIASCATFVKDGEGPNGEELRYDLLPAFDRGGLFKVDAAGTGFIMIKRRVIEDARMHVGPPDPDGTPALFQMKYSATGHIKEWEDVDFTLRASRLGYVVAADMGAHCGHRKSINLDAVAEMIHVKELEIRKLKGIEASLAKEPTAVEAS